MELMTAGDIVNSCTAEIMSGRADTAISDICIDSRKVKKGSLFVALVGKRSDGHDFVNMAFENGAAAVLVEKDVPTDENKTVLKAVSTLRAMQSLAAAYRQKYNIPVIAVTGSVGKTTTKEMCAAVLGAKFKTLKNEGNLNSDIGMPLSVFGLDKTHEAAVFEMGMSAKGEISLMTHIARPFISIITNIGFSHIERLGSRENILKAKLEIENGMYPDGIMVLNGDDSMLWGQQKNILHTCIYYGIENKECSFRAENIIFKDNKTNFDIVSPFGVINCSVNAIGTHFVYNALAAAASGLALGLNFDEIIAGLLSFKSVDMRQNIFESNGMTIVDDCYNASPDSMRAAISVLKTLKGKRKIAVLADMLELGKKNDELHEAVGKMTKGLDFLIAYGKNRELYKKGAMAEGMPEENILCYDNMEQCSVYLKNLCKEEDCILFKGSRGMHLEELEKLFLN